MTAAIDVAKLIGELFPVRDSPHLLLSTLSESSAAFARELSNARSSFFKFETLPFYKVEAESASLEAFRDGNAELASHLLEDLLLPAENEYKSLISRGLRLRRVRLFEHPLSQYLRWELEAYKITSRWGEEIAFVAVDKILPLAFVQDFLLFDTTSALVRKYSPEGVFIEDLNISAIEYLGKLERLAETLWGVSQPLNEFLNNIE